jgi:hypothetical protein
MKQNLIFTMLSFLVYGLGFSQENLKMNNPIIDGWYADTEGAVFDDTYWVYPTFSDDYGKQLHFDAFSSTNLVDWKKHERILDTTKIKWLRQALWARSIIAKNQKYFLAETLMTQTMILIIMEALEWPQPIRLQDHLVIIWGSRLYLIFIMTPNL